MKNDLLARKKTLSIMYLLTHETPFTIIKDYYSAKINEEELLQNKQTCIAYIEGSGCVEYTRIIQQLHLHHAEELFGQIEVDSEWKGKLDRTFFDAYR